MFKKLRLKLKQNKDERTQRKIKNAQYKAARDNEKLLHKIKKHNFKDKKADLRHKKTINTIQTTALIKVLKETLTKENINFLVKKHPFILIIILIFIAVLGWNIEIVYTWLTK